MEEDRGDEEARLGGHVSQAEKRDEDLAKARESPRKPDDAGGSPEQNQPDAQVEGDGAPEDTGGHIPLQEGRGKAAKVRSSPEQITETDLL